MLGTNIQVPFTIIKIIIIRILLVIVTLVVRTRPRAIPLAMITMRKALHGFL